MQLPERNQLRTALTIDIHNANTHYAGDDDQGETGSVVVHQQQPIDSSLHRGEEQRNEWTGVGLCFPNYFCIVLFFYDGVSYIDFFFQSCVFLSFGQVTHPSGQRHAQQESDDGHRQCDNGLVFDDPVGPDLIHDGRHQSLQKAELQSRRRSEIRL